MIIPAPIDIPRKAQLRLLRRMPTRLAALALFITERCDCRCTFCHIWGEGGWAHDGSEKKTSGDLDCSAIEGLTREIRERFGAIYVVVTGGEPLLHKAIDQLLANLKSQGHTVALLTNGFALKQHIEAVVENVDHVQISIKGPPELNDEVSRRPGLYDRIMDGVGQIVERKSRHNRNTPIVLFNSALTAETAPFVRATADSLSERCRQIGAEVRFRTANHGTRSISGLNKEASGRAVYAGFEPLLWTTEEKGQQYQRMLKERLGVDSGPFWRGFLADKTPADLVALKRDIAHVKGLSEAEQQELADFGEYFTNIDNTFGYHVCTSPWAMMTIRSNGDVFPCVDLPDYSWGNVYRDSLDTIWLGERARAFRGMMMDCGIHPLCNRCCVLIQQQYSFLRRLARKRPSSPVYWYLKYCMLMARLGR